MIKAALKLLLISLWTLLWLLPVWISKLCGKIAWRDRFIRIFCKGFLHIAGIRLKVTGSVSDRRPLLLVSNHLSYFDVPMIASQAAARFTPKTEIGSWPVIAGICRLTDSIFVDRRPGKVKAVSRDIHAALAKGDVVSLFPESTTGNGLHVLPFKSGFFSLAEEAVGGRELVVQPAAITYTHIRRLPVDSSQWPALAWYGDMYLAPHLWNVLKLGPLDAELIFLPPMTLSEYGDRKHLALACHAAITQAIESVRNKCEKRTHTTFSSLLSRLSRLKP